MKVENVERANELRRDLVQVDQKLKDLQADQTKPGVVIRYSQHQYSSNDSNTYAVEDPMLRELCYFVVHRQLTRTRIAIVAELTRLGVELAELWP